MNLTTGMVFGPVGIIIGLAGVGYSVWQTKNLDKTTRKLDMTLDEINTKNPVDIQESVVNKAIERAVDREVRLTVTETARRVREDIHAEISKEIKKAIEAEYKKIANEVSEKISEQVAAIDEYALKERVQQKAEDKVMKKLDGCLDGALGMFNNQLGNVNKIYQNIANTITGNNSTNHGVTFKMS